MIISDGWRLILYMLASMLPVWMDWLAKSQDMSLRGMMGPALSSFYAAIIVALAKTSAKMDRHSEPMEVKTVPGQPLQVEAPPGKPVDTLEAGKELEQPEGIPRERRNPALPVTPEAARVRP